MKPSPTTWVSRWSAVCHSSPRLSGGSSGTGGTADNAGGQGPAMTAPAATFSPRNRRCHVPSTAALICCISCRKRVRHHSIRGGKAMKTSVTLAVVTLALAGGVWATDTPQMPKPQKEHEWLKQLEGEWVID